MATINPYSGLPYKRADMTPKRDASISGNPSFSAYAHKMSIHEKNVNATTDAKAAAAYDKKLAVEEIISRVNARLEASLRAAEDLERSHDSMREIAMEFARELYDNQLLIRFDIENDLGNKLVVRMVRRGSGEVLYTYPPQRSLELQRLAKQFPGIFMNQVV